MYYYDLHCHTSHSSDSPSKIEEIIKIAKKRGVDGIAITDHNRTYKGPLEIDGIRIIPGNEITVKGSRHLLAYFIDKNIKPRMDAKKTILEVQKQGGFSVLAHPFRGFSGWESKRPKKKRAIEEAMSVVDGIEVSNASDSGDARELALEMAKKFKKFQTAGSDAHIPGQIGFSVVEVKEHLTKENFKEMLKDAKIILRPESEDFRRSIRYWKKIAVSPAKYIGVYKIQPIKALFLRFIVRNYLRIENFKFEKIISNLLNTMI